jgi:diguanylate cyclase (GGDEF)-like protein
VISRILAGFFPKLKPELRHFRGLLLRKILLALLAFFAVWYALFIMTAISRAWPFVTILQETLLFLGYAAVSLFLLLMVRREHVLGSAYLLAIVLVLLAVISSIAIPGGGFLLNAALLLSITIAAAVISRPAAYFFAVCSILLVIAEVLAGLGAGQNPAPFAPQVPAIYSAVGFSVIAIALAAILSSLAKRVETTIGNLQLQAEKLAHLAHTDPLTGLANRRYLVDQLKIEFARARRYNRPFCLVFIDLDNFKLINDRFGHMVGDQALQGAAAALKSPLRTTDMLARIGGDEFAVLLPETDLEGGVDVIEKLQSALKTFGSEFQPELVEITFSAGLSQLQEEDHSFDQILTRADDAQYLAKRGGVGELRTDLDLEKTAELEALELRNGSEE